MSKSERKFKRVEVVHLNFLAGKWLDVRFDTSCLQGGLKELRPEEWRAEVHITLTGYRMHLRKVL